MGDAPRGASAFDAPLLRLLSVAAFDANADANDVGNAAVDAAVAAEGASCLLHTARMRLAFGLHAHSCKMGSVPKARY